ncbi:MAG: 3-carboxy-cis,cis-muconate cycloisomerase [Rhodobacteraceae bacterium HLUCCO07]|nr:MAG: 3-carboxy-cis,cis-muconate cycloisomerase [Rhodobacteraceae bacterium HLUCCO07]
MAGSVFDSPLYTRLFPTGEVGRLFTDSTEIRAMLIVEGTLAKVQGGLGVIPETSGAFLHRAAMEVQIDPAGLANATGQNGVSVPGLVAAFRNAIEAPDHAQFVHWGATSQDIIDTALMLRLKQVLSHYETALRRVLAALARQAEAHADLAMPARTWGQHATPTSFGATAAAWGGPLLALLGELDSLRAHLWVSLSGAAGTGAALGDKAGETRAALAKALGLTDPGHSWHTDRTPILMIAGWIARLNTALGKMGEDMATLAMTGIGEVRLGSSGCSSTMPQKQNPVGPGALAALAAQGTALNAAIQGAGLHRLDRDGPAWFTEWLALPQLCLGGAAALEHARDLAETLIPLPEAMTTALNNGQGLIHAEALSFALAAKMPRPEAQAEVKALCTKVSETGCPLRDLAGEAHPDLDLSAVFDPIRQLGEAPVAARRFADAVHALPEPQASE